MMKKSFKKVLLLCMTCVMMFLTGCESLSLQPVSDGQYDIKGLPVYINLDNTCSQAKYDNLEKILSTAPDYLLKNCTGMHLVLSDEFYQTFRNKHIAAGFAEYDTLEIYLNDTYANLDFEITVLHELAHIYDFTHGLPGVDSSYTSEFLALFEKEKYNVNFEGRNSEYCLNNNDEFFAECFVFYVLEPERLPESLIQYYDSLPK